jgi:hypothetical protein
MLEGEKKRDQRSGSHERERSVDHPPCAQLPRRHYQTPRILQNSRRGITLKPLLLRIAIASRDRQYRAQLIDLWCNAMVHVDISCCGK